MKRENILPDPNILLDLTGRDVFKWTEKKVQLTVELA